MRAGERGRYSADDVDGLAGGEVERERLRNLPLGVRLAEKLLAVDRDLERVAVPAAGGGEEQIFAGLGGLVDRGVANAAR